MTLATASVCLLCLVGSATAIAACGGDVDRADSAAAARPAKTAPLEIALEPRHRSGVTGTATLAPSGANLKVTLKLDKHLAGPLMAHIHTGPCSNEPTMSNPRIWVGLTDVVDGRSESTVVLVTLPELQAEDASINVHDPAHANRPLVCGDIPRAG
jgi:hypothetical protein